MKSNKNQKTTIPEAWFDNQPVKFEPIKELKEVADRFSRAELEARELIKLLHSQEDALRQVSLKGFMTMPPVDGATVLSLLTLVDETDLERAKKLRNENQSLFARADRVKLSDELEDEIIEHYKTWINNPKNLKNNWFGVAESKFKLSRHILNRTLTRKLPQKNKTVK